MKFNKIRNRYAIIIDRMFSHLTLNNFYSILVHATKKIKLYNAFKKNNILGCTEKIFTAIK